MLKRRTFSWGARSVVDSVDISPDGQWLAAGANHEGAVCVWDLATGAVVAKLTLAKAVDLTTEVRFSPNGKQLLVRVAQRSSNLQAEFSIAPGTWRATKRSRARGSWLPAPGPNGLECICCKPSQASGWQVLAEVFDRGTRRRITTVKTPVEGMGVPESVTSVAWLPDGTLVIAHANSLGVGLYDSKKGKLIRRLEDAPNKRRHRGNWWVAVAPSGEAIATTRQEDRKARVWRLASNELLHELGGHAESHFKTNSFHPLRCCFSPDGSALAVNAGQKKGGGAVTLHMLGEETTPVQSGRDDEDDEEAEAVDALLEQTVRALASLPDRTPRSIDRVLLNYLRRGSKLHCSPTVLIDYFSISSPTIPEQAGLSAKQAAAVEARYDVLARKLFQRSR